MKYDTGKRLSIIVVGFILLCISTAVPAAAQDVNVTATVDSTNISLGDWIHLTVEAKHPSSLQVAWQALRDSIGPFEIVRLDTLRTEEANGVVTEKRALIVSRYEPGSSAIPPIGVTYRTSGDTTVHTAQSNPIPIEVRGIAVDTALAIKDLKQPLTVPLSWQEISLYTGIVFLICLLAYGAYWYWKKKQRQTAGIVEEKPVIPPDILALQQLRELEGKHVWQSGEVKLFYSEATEIVRRYFEGRYGVAALEMTTDEVLDQLKSLGVPRGMPHGMLATINEFLTGADLVKFAKFVPTPSDNEQVIPVAAAIVQKTKPSSIPAASPSAAAPSAITVVGPSAVAPSAITAASPSAAAPSAITTVGPSAAAPGAITAVGPSAAAPGAIPAAPAPGSAPGSANAATPAAATPIAAAPSPTTASAPESANAATPASAAPSGSTHAATPVAAAPSGSTHAATPAAAPSPTTASAPGSAHAATPVAQPSHIPDQTPDKNAGVSEHV
jgi:hypothetical protein